jgi:2-methylcitrate dehydratase PrpD
VTPVAPELASWVHDLVPTGEDLALARRSLLDTVAVALAARDDPLRGITRDIDEAGRWATLAHVLDFDDLHLESTSHISAVCVPATLATGGGARAYLAAAGVMARLGTALGWDHYASGWHATCTAGAPAAAVAAAVSLGLTREQTAQAIALAVPAAGGTQRAFGTMAKSLQVGFATSAGVRAARLVAAGADADPAAADQWLALTGGDPGRLERGGPAIPGGLAVKLFPCCYALQRPIGAMRQLLTPRPAADQVREVRVFTPRAAVQPLIHPRPRTGLEAKFSLEYAIAATILDGFPDFASFSDAAVRRPQARRLVSRVRPVLDPGGSGLLAGAARIELDLTDGTTRAASLDVPPGSPLLPPTPEEMAAKLASCGVPPLMADETEWDRAAELLRAELA